MTGVERIYLDNAATSWPKPESVYRAVDEWQRGVGASFARGTSAAVDASRDVVDRARRSVAQLLGESDPRRIVFTTSGTDSLNTAILGLLRDGDHVVTTVVEHNAVLRPLNWLASRSGGARITVTRVGCDRAGLVAAEDVIAAIRPETRLVAVIHASNVTGAVQPIEAIAERTRPRGIRLLVDAAQTLGRWPIDVATLGADLIAGPGHKGLYGPLGTGVLWIAPGVEDELHPLRHGGAASGGELPHVPTVLPDKYEAGNLNVPGLAGLAAGVEHVLELGVATVRSQLAAARHQIVDSLRSIEGVQLYGPDDSAKQAGVVSFSAEGYDPHELATVLASTAGAESRAGLQCAPKLHESLGTAAGGGLLRLSPSPATTNAEVDATVDAIRQLVGTPTT